MRRLGLFLYDLVLSLWVGGTAVFTLLVTPPVFKAFDRDRAGEVVNVLFPVYFPFLLAVSVVALLLLAALRAGRLAIVLAALAVAVNAWHLWKTYPDSMAVRRQVTSFVKESPDSPARREFRRLHGQSSAMNVAVLLDGLVLLAMARGLSREKRG